MFLARLFLAASLAILALPALADEVVRITEAYARFLPGAKSGAAFLVIENLQPADDRLIAVASPVAGKAELHSHQAGADGMMRMGPIEGGISLPAGANHALARGGDHVMLMMLTSVPKEGETFPLTLTFEAAGDITIDIPVDNHR